MKKVKHSGNAGDIIYSLNTIKAIGEQVILFLNLDQPAKYAPGFTHPLGNVMLNSYMFNNLKPLLKSLDFIYDVLPYNGQKVDYDLDKFRESGFNLSAYDIKRWYEIVYPELACEVEEQIFEIDEPKNDYLVINRTQRYNNSQIDYTFLNEVENTKVFVGTESEFKLMESKIEGLEYYKPKDFLDLAYFIDAGIFIGNQSMCFAIAEQMKSRRLLELYYGCPNVIPMGGEHYEAFNQKGFIHGINQLLK
jgi:hypothetical protein